MNVYTYIQYKFIWLFVIMCLFVCAAMHVSSAGGQIRTLITIIIKGRYDDSTEHKIERELLGDLEALTYSRHQIQVLFRGPYDSIQVVLLLPMRTLGHLLYLAVHYPGLLRGLDILQIIDISSLTIIDFREITGMLLYYHVLCVFL